MFQSLRQPTLLIPVSSTRLIYPVLEAFILGVAFLTPNALANPIEATELSSEQPATAQENSNITDGIIPQTPNVVSFEQNVETLETEETRSSIAQKPSPRSESLQDRPCPVFIPITNTIKPEVSSVKDEDAENLEVPTSSCAAALMGVSSALESVERDIVSTSSATETFIAQEELPDRIPEPPSSPPSNGEETQPVDESDEWHIKFQPYVTIPVSTYGTATVRGRSANLQS